LHVPKGVFQAFGVFRPNILGLGSARYLASNLRCLIYYLPDAEADCPGVKRVAHHAKKPEPQGTLLRADPPWR
jgi:hypothetical protein